MLGTPVPFREALQRHDVRRLMPTSLSTSDLQQMDAGILRSSLFSARNLYASFLGQLKEKIRSILNPQQVAAERAVTPENPLGMVTEGESLATARRDLRDILAELGYQPDPDKRGTIEDLASTQRLELVVKTNTQIAQGYGYWRQGQDPAVLDQWPASELFRAEARKEERDWAARWLAAAREVGDGEAITAYGTTGRMVARKDSPVWQALGDGAGGYADDALHNPYPPFAFSSGMDVRDVDREDAVALGLIGRDDQVVPQTQEFAAALPES